MTFKPKTNYENVVVVRLPLWLKRKPRPKPKPNKSLDPKKPNG